VYFNYRKFILLIKFFTIERRSIDQKKLAPYNDILGVASTNVRAYSNGNDTFYSNESNYLYGIYMGLKWQCVEFARRWTFIRKSSVFESVEGANDMWNQLKYVERVVDKQKFPLKQHSNGSPYPPINESYLIYPIQKDMPYGHVAVIVEVLPNAIRIAEQNFYFHYWSHHYARQIPLVFRNGLYYVTDQYEVYGWIEIDDNKQLQPLDRSTAREIKMKDEQILDSSSSLFYANIHIYYCFLFVVLFISHLMFY
jgi:glutathionylspermidine amidase/synthetase